MNKTEIELIVDVLRAVISLVEQVDPASEQNKVVIAVAKAISLLQELGI